jgi:endonuclease/exonuclease/phosphatase family metal-dependent hydrolase
MLFLVLGALGLTLLLLVLLLFWASAGYDGAPPALYKERPVERRAEALDVIRVVSWNIGFAGGREGAPTDRHTSLDVARNLGDIVKALQVLRPDVLLVQEIDLPSSRSGDVDQVDTLMRDLELPYACFTTTWRKHYVPFPYWPPSLHIGGIHSGQAVLSRYPLEECQRVTLPQPSEYPWWYNRFFLRRALQSVRVRLDDARSVLVLNAHLEAFSLPNRHDQARHLAALAGQKQGPLIVGGDLNSVPPKAKTKRGFHDEVVDFSADDTVEIALGVKGLREAFLSDAPAIPEAKSFTFPARAPTRRLDYLFARGLGPSVERQVKADALGSDHLPVLAIWNTPKP